MTPGVNAPHLFGRESDDPAYSTIFTVNICAGLLLAVDLAISSELIVTPCHAGKTCSPAILVVTFSAGSTEHTGGEENPLDFKIVFVDTVH